MPTLCCSLPLETNFRRENIMNASQKHDGNRSAPFFTLAVRCCLNNTSCCCVVRKVITPQPQPFPRKIWSSGMMSHHRRIASPPFRATNFCPPPCPKQNLEPKGPTRHDSLVAAVELICHGGAGQISLRSAILSWRLHHLAAESPPSAAAPLAAGCISFPIGDL